MVPPDYVDALFFSSDRPVRMRVHILINGKPYWAAWDDYMMKLFDYYDRSSSSFVTMLGKEIQHFDQNGIGRDNSGVTQ